MALSSSPVERSLFAFLITAFSSYKVCHLCVGVGVEVVGGDVGLMKNTTYVKIVIEAEWDINPKL